MADYDGRLFVVSGAAGGIGRETVPLLLGKGARVHLIDVAAAPLEAMAAELAAPDRVTTAVSSLDGPEACREALEGVGRPVYGLVHLAGIFAPERFDDDARADYDRVMLANLHNAFDLTWAVVPRLDPEDVTRLVYVSSMAFRRGAFDHTAYTIAKGGIVGLVRSLSRRLAPKVLVNALAPGHIETGMPAHIWADQARASKMLTEIPLQRRGHPREVATVIDFLSGPGATYITGQTINIDGGVVNG